MEEPDGWRGKFALEGKKLCSKNSKNKAPLQDSAHKIDDQNHPNRTTLLIIHSLAC